MTLQLIVFIVLALFIAVCSVLAVTILPFFSRSDLSPCEEVSRILKT